MSSRLRQSPNGTPHLRWGYNSLRFHRRLFVWMLIVETILKIRRLAHVQGKSIKAICRELGISRKVVRKVLRTDETEFKYERTRQPQPKLGPWRGQLDGMLLANEAKSSRERLTLIRIRPATLLLIDGREELVEEIATVEPDIRAYIATQITAVLDDPNFDHFLEGNVRGPAGRTDIVYDRLLAISRLDGR